MDIVFTDRVNRILEMATDKVDVHQALTPLHLFLAMCEENSGVCGELSSYLIKQYGFSFLHDFSKNLQPFHPAPITLPCCSVPVSPEVETLFTYAAGRMHRYNQIRLNEGHLMQAILKFEPTVHSLLTENDIAFVENAVCASRDMLVAMDHYRSPDSVGESSYIRRAISTDLPALMELVEEQFGSGWIETVQNGFNKDEISIFLAKDNDRIIGFACYESFKNKKGTFGPMGVVKGERSKGVGALLLHHSLSELKKKDYRYVVIEGAGPIEFYEKECKAVLIPIYESR
ncbi:GNAT family N-acetyltransferase [Bacillus tianshenii]|uniref:GNAT family N-acetyltransferase n=1 Tax=Sutcliffiella tianshenii TaxID=1463404 RepID=UPI001CD686C7|nr:GNAT family N-acetyltransferase [Bacillus tianshenii]MCA1319082.1 GNAT family N-acetyltransferase [Bacillus tianshenii]